MVSWGVKKWWMGLFENGPVHQWELGRWEIKHVFTEI